MKEFKDHKELVLFYLTEILDLFILYLFLDYITINKAIIITIYLFLKLLCFGIINIVFNKFYDEEIGSDEYYEK